MAVLLWQATPTQVEDITYKKVGVRDDEEEDITGGHQRVDTMFFATVIGIRVTDAVLWSLVCVLTWSCRVFSLLL